MKVKPVTEISNLNMKNKKSHQNTQKEMQSYLQYNTLIKVVCTGPSLQGGESHVSSSEGGDITKLFCT